MTAVLTGAYTVHANVGKTSIQVGYSEHMQQQEQESASNAALPVGPRNLAAL